MKCKNDGWGGERCGDVDGEVMGIAVMEGINAVKYP